ncbi:MAG: ArsR family transcriptional regulator [Georgfuchsia sp.]
MQTDPILQFLKKNGQQLDRDIASGTGMKLSEVHLSLSKLSERGEISSCSVTRFKDGKPVVGKLCRIAGTIPPAAPGRKPGAKVVTNV